MNIFTTDFELPPLEVIVPNVYFSRNLNPNEDLFATLDYSADHVIIYSVGIIYMDEIKASLVFYYKDIKFRIWDHFEDFLEFTNKITF